MPKPISAAAVFPDDDLQAEHAGHDNAVERTRPLDRGQLVPAAWPGSDSPAPFTRLQKNCYEALSLALKEGRVFAAVTGPARSGKTRVLDAVLADWNDRSLRCIRIGEPDKVSARLAGHIEATAYAEADKPETLERHIVLAIDNAHLASDDLLGCLNRLAQMREPGRRVPQVLLVGRPELWTRLAGDQYAPLARRLAIRGTLPAFEEDAADPWASVEQEVSQLRGDGEVVRFRSADPASNLVEPVYENAYARHYEPQYPSAIDPATLALDEATVPPPSMYALFPDPSPAAPPPSESRRRLLLPLGCLAVTVVAFGLVLSLYDWPDLLGDMPWAQAPKSTPFNLTPGPQAGSRTLPQAPTWAQAAVSPAAPATPPAAAVPPPAPPTDTAAAPPAPPPVETKAPVVTEPPRQTAQPVRPPAPQAPVSEPAERRAEPTAAGGAPPPTAPAAAPIATPAPPAPREPAANTQFAALPVPPLPPPPPSTFAPITIEPAPAAAPPVAQAALPAPAPPAVRSNPAPRSSAAPAVVTAAPLPPAIIALLLRRGDEQVAIGDLSAARLLFERAAEAGSATAALHLARTFDPEFLPAADARAFGDRTQARTWYTKAAALGSREAVDRTRGREGR